LGWKSEEPKRSKIPWRFRIFRVFRTQVSCGSDRIYAQQVSLMTESQSSSSFFSEPRGVLVLRADSLLGQVLTLSLAQRNARLALTCRTESPPFWETSARATRTGAIVLPLEEPGPLTSEIFEALMKRVVEDFGRLDLVVCPLAFEAEDHAVSAQAIAVEIHRLASAARPHLRRARPTGFFLIAADASLPPEFSLEQEAEHLAREIATGPQGRPRVLARNLQTISEDTLKEPETLERLRAQFQNIFDTPSPQKLPDL
jgi:NAD(P)-dependent dehydrogenase (short-subunit alcohol dehydrogenase family)